MKAGVLVVDDDLALAEMLGIVLRNEGLDVVHCSDGASALEAFHQHRPDLVLLDVMLPGMGGIDAARQLYADCHIVFATAYDQYAVEAFEHGAIDYLLKPVTLARLDTTVARLRRQREHKPQDIGAQLARLAQLGDQLLGPLVEP